MVTLIITIFQILLVFCNNNNVVFGFSIGKYNHRHTGFLQSARITKTTTTTINRKIYNMQSSSNSDDGISNTNGNNDIELKDTTNTTTASNKQKQQQQKRGLGGGGGLKNALIMGPPLILKFLVVLIVKFLTDVIVFPLLYLYRFIRLIKHKILLLLFGITPKNNNVTTTTSKLQPRNDGNEPDYNI